MSTNYLRKLDRLRASALRLAMVSLTLLVGLMTASAQNGSTYFNPGNLVVSRSVYDNNPNNVLVGQLLPPNCQATQVECNGNATNDGTYPAVWNNDIVDSSFGITSKLFLDQYTPAGSFINSLEVPNSSQKGVPPQKDQLVTSFSSKSGSARESDERRILSGFPESDEFGLGGGQPLGFQQQIIQIAVAAATS